MVGLRAPTVDTGTFPIVSVITPSFNQARYIERTLESVRTQDYPNLEHIVVDGGSTDGTLEILRRQTFAQWTSERDRGQSHALNKGLALATGEIIGWLNSDDMYTPGAVRRAVRALQLHLDAPFVYGAWNIVDESDRFLEHRPARRSAIAKLINPPWGILPGDAIGQPSAFVKAAALREVGGIDERLHMAMDYDLWARLVKVGTPAIVDETQALFRVSAAGKTSFTPPAMWAESFAVIARYGNVRRAHHVLLPLFYYAILRDQSIIETRRSLLAATAKMEVPERELLDARLVLGYAHWSQAAQYALQREIRPTIAFGLAALRSGALQGAELAIVARGVLIVAGIQLDRFRRRSAPLAEFHSKANEESAYG